jgi:predicted molibdopterin-dependent oxidoreductase YjgC
MEFNYATAWDVTAEIIKQVSAYRNVTLKQIESDGGCFADKRIKHRKFIPVSYSGLQYVPGYFPYALTTKRHHWHFTTADMTKRTQELMQLDPEAFCLIHSNDAKNERIKDGEIIALLSEVGRVKIKAKISEDTLEGVIVAPFHYKEVLINRLFPLRIDSLTKEPQLKATTVKIEKL